MKHNRFVLELLVVCSILMLAATAPATAQPSPESLCQNSVQGRIAWNYSGDKQWAPDNLARLCRGAPSPYEPGVCFQRVMHSGIDYGGGTRWDWKNALALCAGADDADKRISCFQRRLESGRSWRIAIQECTINVPVGVIPGLRDVQILSELAEVEAATSADSSSNPFGSPGGGGGAARSILPDGKVQLTYPDGRRVLLYAGGQTTIYPDGTQQKQLYSTAARPPIPPSAPSSAEGAWLQAHSARLLDVMRTLVGGDQAAISNYLQFEGAQASVYDQIVKREETIGYLVSE